MQFTVFQGQSFNSQNTEWMQPAELLCHKFIQAWYVGFCGSIKLDFVELIGMTESELRIYNFERKTIVLRAMKQLK